MHITQLTIVGLYIIGLFGISIFARKKASTGSQAFVLANRSLSTILLAVSVAGLAIGGASTIGVAEHAYNVGLAAGWYDLAWAIGAIIMALVAADKYRNLNCTTVPELFERFYDRKGRIICVIGMITIQLVITSLQYVAGGAILSSLLPEIFSLKTGMITSAVVFIGITLLGGLWSASLANILNVSLIYLGITVGAILITLNQGGLGEIALKLPVEKPWLNPVKGLGWPLILTWVVIMSTQTLSGQWTVQLACAAKDKNTAKKGFIIGAFLMIPIGFLAALMGICAKAIYPDITATLALPKIILTLPPVAAGITLSALWAADVSTACGLLLGSATLFSQDIWKRFIRPHSTDKELLTVVRWAVLVLGLFTFILAFTVAGVLKTLMVGLSLTTAFTVVFLFTIFTPKLCYKENAFYTILVGLITLILWQFIPEIRITSHPIYLEWLVCPLTFLTVSLINYLRKENRILLVASQDK